MQSFGAAPLAQDHNARKGIAEYAHGFEFEAPHFALIYPSAVWAFSSGLE